MLSRDLSLMELKPGNTNMQLIKLFKYFVVSSGSYNVEMLTLYYQKLSLHAKKYSFSR